MSVKNGADTLEKSIGSIVNQSFTDWEFIICDDGSTDSTFDILNRLAAADNRLRIIRNDTSKGLAFSLNACIKLAKSNILARQDADDESDLRRFEIQYPFVTNHPEYAIVGTSWYNVCSDGSTIPCVVKAQPTIRDMINGGIFMHPSWIMRKDMLAKVGYYTANRYTRRSQDYHLVLKLYGAGMRLYNMPELLYYYTADDTTIRRSMNWKNVKGLMWIRFDGYRRNRLPLWAYVFVLKPLVASLVPRKMLYRHYEKTYSKNNHNHKQDVVI